MHRLLMGVIMQKLMTDSLRFGLLILIWFAAFAYAPIIVLPLTLGYSIYRKWSRLRLYFGCFLWWLIIAIVATLLNAILAFLGFA